MGRREQVKLSSIHALAELDRAGWAYEPVGDNEVKLRCPAHDDKTPSASLNTEKNLWQCHTAGCGAKGDIISLLGMILRADRGAMLADLSKRYDLDDAKHLDPRLVEQFCANLGKAGPLLVALEKRGITPAMMQEARLGYHDGRITVPVFDFEGRLANVRRYLPGAPSPIKFRNTPGFGKLRLYRPTDLVHPRVWVCGGEMKALVVGSLLREHGVGAVCASGGEGAWDASWDLHFKDRDVFVCMDIDEAGVKGARSVADRLLRSGLPRSVRVVRLPLDKAKYPKGDVNDYVGGEKATGADLLRLMEVTPPATLARPAAEVAKADAVAMTLHQAARDPMRRRVSVEAVVTAEDANPFLIPSLVSVSCDRDQPGCGSCAVYIQPADPDKGGVEVRIPRFSASVLELMNAPKSAQPDALREACGVPPCVSATFQVLDHVAAKDVRLSPAVGIMRTMDEGGDTMQPGALVNIDVEMNIPYRFSGVVHPSPKDQHATFVIDRVEESLRGALHKFGESVNLADLRAFRPADWTVPTVQAKLDEFYADLERNVTRIHGRRDLHTAIDVTYCSVLHIPAFRSVLLGVINALLIGDSAQGKSETCSRIKEHYRAGERVSCKTASIAGLVGGLQQIGSRWFISWGIIPTHDRGLVILEEVKGLEPRAIASMTDMRSSGIAEIPKIEKRRTNARTRLIWVSNPRDGAMRRHSYGIEAVRRLVGEAEDIRRFDLVVAVRRDEITAVEIREARKAEGDPRFSPQLCNDLIRWAWTRTEQQVIVPPDVQDRVERLAEGMTLDFSSEIPIVDEGTMKAKLLRVAAALAVRTFSCPDEDETKILVRTSHVAIAEQWLRGVYTSQSLAYDVYSASTRKREILRQPEVVLQKLREMKNGKEFAEQMLAATDIQPTDVQDWSGADRETAQEITSFLVRKQALMRVDRFHYRKTEPFVALLRMTDLEKFRTEKDEDVSF